MADSADYNGAFSVTAFPSVDAKGAVSIDLIRIQFGDNFYRINENSVRVMSKLNLISNSFSDFYIYNFLRQTEQQSHCLSVTPTLALEKLEAQPQSMPLNFI